MESLYLALIILLIIAIVLVVIWIGAPERGRDSVSISDGRSVVTVRNAGGTGLTVTFGNTPEVPLECGAEPFAEEEVTVLDMLRDPRTPEKVRRLIESNLEELGYQVNGNNEIPSDVECIDLGIEPEE